MDKRAAQNKLVELSPEEIDDLIAFAELACDMHSINNKTNEEVQRLRRYRRLLKKLKGLKS